MVARGISPGFKLLVTRSQQFGQLRSSHVMQLTRYFPNNGSNNNVKSRCDITFSPVVLLDSYNLNFPITRRWKYGKKQKRKGDDSDSDEDDEGDENLEAAEIVAHNTRAKITISSVSSMRIDAIVKAALNMPRNKVEVALYEGKLRINERKPPKKGMQIHIDDVIDYVHGPSPKNENFLLVTRVTILDANLNNDHYNVKILREKSLLIENYTDTWQPVSDNS